MRRKPQPPDPRTADMFDAGWQDKCAPSKFMFDASKLALLSLDINGHDTLLRYIIRFMPFIKHWAGVVLTGEMPNMPPTLVDRSDFTNIGAGSVKIQRVIQLSHPSPLLIIGTDWWNGEPWRVERAKLVLCS